MCMMEQGHNRNGHLTAQNHCDSYACRSNDPLSMPSTPPPVHPCPRRSVTWHVCPVSREKLLIAPSERSLPSRSAALSSARPCHRTGRTRGPGGTRRPGGTIHPACENGGVRDASDTVPLTRRGDWHSGEGGEVQKGGSLPWVGNGYPACGSVVVIAGFCFSSIECQWWSV